MNKTASCYKVFDTYYLRTPVFSFSEFEKIIKKTVLTETDFKIIIQNPIFKEALYVASPELYQQIIKWTQGELKDIKKIERLQYAILKYYTRISSRCTPFGLFASCVTGKFNSTTTVKLNDIAHYKRVTRFDTTFLALLLTELHKNTLLKKHVLFFPNSSIYKIGDHYRYIEYYIENKKRSYSLEGIKYTKYIETILTDAKNGNTIPQLALLLIDEDITQKDAEDFIQELIANQILVSELEITVTGADYLDNLLQKLNKINGAKALYKKLKSLKNYLSSLDVLIGNPIEKYTKTTEIAKSIVPEFNPKYLYQTDCFSKAIHNTLSKETRKKLTEVLVIFNQITLATASATIENFKRAFLKRFEDTEVSLTTLLDADNGIGYGDKKYDNTSMLDNLSPLRTKKRYERIIWSDVDTIIQKKLIQALTTNSYEISLTTKDFKELPTNWNDLPDTISSIIEVYTVNEKEQLFIQSIGGASATNLVGRFSYGNEQLLNYVNQISAIEAEMNPHQVLAEIVHLPEARTGNILQRPVFRDYEIPYLGKSSVTTEKQIPIEDILVSVKNDTVVLRSKKLNKEVLPRLGNAHNFGANPLPIYQFLCELQTQNKRSSIGFSWNPIFKKQAFLPRVVFNDFIFSKARWNISVAEFKKIYDAKHSVSSIKEWQQTQKLPKYVELVDGDNRLFVNMQNSTSLKMLFETIKKRTYFVLEEFLYANDSTVTDKNNSCYRNQFVVSYYNNQKLNETNE